MEFNFEIPLVSMVLKADKMLDSVSNDDIGMFLDVEDINDSNPFTNFRGRSVETSWKTELKIESIIFQM